MQINIDQTHWYDRVWAALIFFTRLPFWRLHQPPKACYATVVEHWPLTGWLTGGTMAATLYFGSWYLPYSIAVLLAIVSFSLINNSVKLGIYARRFSIHTMKLVGASWGFIRRPFMKHAFFIGVCAALIAIIVLAVGLYVLYTYEPGVLAVITPQVMIITAVAVLVFGILITLLCSYFSVNMFLKMKAGELYKI